MRGAEYVVSAACGFVLGALLVQIGVGIGRNEKMALRPPQALETARIEYASGWKAIHYDGWRICRRGDIKVEGPDVRCDKLPPTSDLNKILVALER